MFNVFGFDKIQLSGLCDIYTISLYGCIHTKIQKTDQQKIADYLFISPAVELVLRNSSS